MTSQSPPFNAQSLSNALSQLALLGFEGLVADDLHKLNKADDFEEELVVMAEVSASWRVAHKVGNPLLALLHPCCSYGCSAL